MRWADEEPPELPEVAEDPERQEFLEYLTYLEDHDHIEFGAYRLMRYRERLARGEHPEFPSPSHAPKGVVESQESEEWKPDENRLRRQVRWYRRLAVAVVAVVAAMMVAVTLAMPGFGETDVPALNEVYHRYLEQGVEETGAVNAVAGMILDYRAFDTFGESTVLFAASMCVVLILRQQRPGRPDGEPCDPILHQVGRLILPEIVVFGVYVVCNGHLSPGGGFSGGAILGGGLILAALVLGQDRMDALVSPGRISGVTVVSLLAYAVMKGYSFYTGANHVGWEVPKGTPGSIFSGGFILPLNICVGLIVACTMYSFYALFTRREEE